MSQLNEQQNKANADFIYYDVTVSNLQSTTSQPQVFQYIDTRTVPFLKNPEDYCMSIVRFTLDTASLPVFIPLIQPNQGNRDLTVYSVTLTYNGVEAQTFIDWNPQLANATATPPNQTYNGLQDNQNGYYNCYSYSWFIERVYEAMVASFDVLVATAGLVRAVAPNYAVGTFPPIINWDSTTNSAIMFADGEYYDVRNLFGNGVVSMFMNAPLFELFNSFPATNFGYVGVTNGKNVRIPFTDIGGTNMQNIIPPGQAVPAVGTGYKFWRAITWTQEQSTISSWSSILSIVFTSNTLPVEPSQVSTPVVYSNGVLIRAGGNNADISTIITDLASNDGNYRPNLVYNPSAEYRRIALKGNRPLYTIDLNIFYKLRSGELVPFTLLSNESCTMKILFEKKK
jgi:hypothetical protein